MITKTSRDMQMKTSDKNRQNLLRLFPYVLIAFAAAIPFGVNYGVSHYPLKSSGNTESWIGFWGSYAGGLFTFITVWWIISDNNRGKRYNQRLKVLEKDVDVFLNRYSEFEQINAQLNNIHSFFASDDADEDALLEAINAQLLYRRHVLNVKRNYTSPEARRAFDEYIMMLDKHLSIAGDDVSEMMKLVKKPKKDADRIKKILEISSHILYRRIDDLKNAISV